MDVLSEVSTGLEGGGRRAPARHGRRPRHRILLIGTGGHGADWCERILPPFVCEGRLEVVGAVDLAPEALVHAQRHLALEPTRCYMDLPTALAETDADACVVVVPPECHEEVCTAALTAGLDVLCEKPLADSLDACVRIVDTARREGRRLGVTMSHRFDQDKLTIRDEIRSGRHGALDYLVYRFTCAFRSFPACGATRHFMPHPLMLDAAVHHLDIIADLAGAPCESVYAETWRPPWAEFMGPSQALVTLRFANGVRAVYEGAFANADGRHHWASEYVRAECELSTLVLDRRRLERFAAASPGCSLSPVGEEVALGAGKGWEHSLLIEQFLAWREGGKPMPTSGPENLRSCAILFAAIESGHTGMPVRPSAVLAEAMANANPTGGAGDEPYALVDISPPCPHAGAEAR